MTMFSRQAKICFSIIGDRCYRVSDNYQSVINILRCSVFYVSKRSNDNTGKSKEKGEDDNGQVCGL